MKRRTMRAGRTWLRAFAVALLAAPGAAQAAAGSGANLEGPRDHFPGHPEVTIDQVVAPTKVRSGEIAQFTVTVSNKDPRTYKSMGITLRAERLDNRMTAVNPYQSVTASQGFCTIADPPTGGVVCDLGDLAGGGSAQIVVTVQIIRAMYQIAEIRNSVSVLQYFDQSPPVWAIYPPRVEGSSEIKLKGLPESCADRDLKLTASAKGAKKMIANRYGPNGDETPDGEGLPASVFDGDLKIIAKGSRLNFDFPLGDAPSGLYELKLAAKFDRGPKQVTEVVIQRCRT